MQYNPLGSQSILTEEHPCPPVSKGPGRFSSFFLVLLIFGTSVSLLAQDVEELGQEAQETSLETTSNLALKIWRFEILQLEGSPLTVGKLVTGTCLLIFSLWLSGLLTRRLERLLVRTGINQSTIGATKTLLFYCFIAIGVMITLELIQVPITVFTLLGGAVAIGVGFGSQNLINNFISGLILLAERPIRVGDLIQVGDLYGTIVSIGTRSTMIRTGSNVVLIIPNSAFLEQNVVNWTLGDDRVRTAVSVGVAYGSPTQMVEALLIQATKSVGQVLTEPEPIVLFTDFGDNALVFEIHFWIKMRSIMDRYTAESKVRFEIDRAFKEGELVIAFPQRDVHIDTASPLEIRLMKHEESVQ